MLALTRWDGFLLQIETRHRQVLGEAEAAARDMIATLATGGDPAPLSHQLMAVDNRLMDLETKITDTWHAQAEQAVFDSGGNVADRDRAYARGEALRHALSDNREELDSRLLAELARQRFRHALTTLPALACGWCGGRYQPPLAFRAVEIPCPACGNRIPFEPGPLMRSVGAIGTHAVAQETVNAEWRAMRTAERRLHAIRPPRPLEPVVAYEAAQITYWRAYLAVRSHFEPELARDPGLEIRSRMEQWYVANAEFEEAWVRAGRPRLAV
jgi:hypothetical protein